MIIRKDADLARHEAISKTFNLIFVSFVTALVIAFGIPPLLALILGESANDTTKTTVTFFTSITTSFFLMWRSSDIIKSAVGLAIDSAAKEKSDEYKRQHPDIEEILRIQQQEYLCTIPPNHRSESAIRLSDPSLIIFEQRLGRDAVIRSLSYNDKLLQGIALASTIKTLKRINKNKKQVDQAEEEIFFNDIYVYLKGWLMLSITHSHEMPISYIQQRYPNIRKPNWRAYVMALEIVRDDHIKKPIVLQAINETLKNDEYKTWAATQANNLLERYLNVLIDELKKNRF
jgi:hypothetical protein